MNSIYSILPASSLKPYGISLYIFILPGTLIESLKE